MKDLVSNVASGFTEEVFVYFLYIGAFVRLSELVCVIKAVECLNDANKQRMTARW